MPFKKLHPHLKAFLDSKEITSPTPFQKASIPTIKSGTSVFCIAEKDLGKTTTLILTTLHKIKCEEFGTAPRAIVLVGSNDDALEIYEEFSKYTRYTDVRVYLADEKSHIDLLKSEIFEGVDILISTTKQMNKLLLLEGVNTTQVKILSIDDADFLAQGTSTADLISITQSIHKCQFVIYAEKMHPALKRLESNFMEHSRIVSISL
ncbi:DEAD/DEAH box helicase [Polaribacter sp. HL-MS24]|uniref:DEAD/DEAH box helicase n=1 Tax=Polaribacter sp. HL-MS24 TaxID=3077735 RepID=UPI0029348BDF|nr:DEAD/DEAH box helicase [Polaribacter sp. HL-MS24]WOC40088.1 DEAD/DEAH box helicase [Polaribacter sp. HL-MS24]